MTADPILQAKLEAWLIEAIVEHDSELLAETLKNGASPNARSSTGISALTIAAGAGFLDNVKLLVEAGANINKRDILTHSDVRTALHGALYPAHIEVADYLVTKGADPRLVNHEGENGVIALITSGLLDASAHEENLTSALSLLGRMLAVPGVVNKPDNNGQNALLAAVYRDIDLRAIDVLLEHGADPNARCNFGGSSVHRDWLADSLPKLRRLAGHETFNVDALDWEGATALAWVQDGQAVYELLGLGANLNHVDDMGRNALAVMLDRQRTAQWPTDVMAQLVSAGIDTTQLDLSGQSVESRLVEIGTPDAKQMLAMIGSDKARKAIKRASSAVTRASRVRGLEAA